MTTLKIILFLIAVSRAPVIKKTETQN